MSYRGRKKVVDFEEGGTLRNVIVAREVEVWAPPLECSLRTRRLLRDLCTFLPFIFHLGHLCSIIRLDRLVISTSRPLFLETSSTITDLMPPSSSTSKGTMTSSDPSPPIYPRNPLLFVLFKTSVEYRIPLPSWGSSFLLWLGRRRDELNYLLSK